MLPVCFIPCESMESPAARKDGHSSQHQILAKGHLDSVGLDIHSGPSS